MKLIDIKIKIGFSLMLIFLFSTACDDRLTELNVDPLGVDPGQGNPNQVMTTILTGAADNYLNLGFGDIAGVMQHTQKDGWFSGHNSYDWDAQEWAGWYGLLRNNKYMMERAEDLGYDFHLGVGYLMRGFLFGTITDLWGDAPYTAALKGNTGEENFLFPTYDSQDVIYEGVIADLEQAASIFANSDNTGLVSAYDVYYNGNIENWHKLANSLLLRYYMRISDKMSDKAKSGIERIASSGVIITSAEDDAMMDFIGASGNDSWPSNTLDGGSNFRRIKAGQPFLDRLMDNDDPRLEVWFDPVHVQFIANPDLPVSVEPYIRKNGVVQDGVASMLDAEFLAQKAAGNVFTRHYNPDSLAMMSESINDDMYVGIPPGILAPSNHNFNPTPGQNVQNQHVSQLDEIYRETAGDLLTARIISAAEVHFILAEAALKGWSVGSAEDHYNMGVKESLSAWGVEDMYDDFIQMPGVEFNNTLQRIIEQKWIASWTAATEAWFDYRRTGFPQLEAGPASDQPVLPVRFNYGNDEIAFNPDNLSAGRQGLQVTEYSGPRQNDSQWSKPWIIQDTNKPW